MKPVRFMGTMRRIVALLILFCLTFLVAPRSASAAPITVPPGLSPGTQYRLAFVTSTNMAATSSDIADYNTFVTGVANSVPELAALGTNWAVIGSTAAIAARDNTNTNPIVSAGNLIFDLAGHLLATNNAALWDASIDSPLTATETGGTTYQYTWTGTSTGGIQSSTTEVLGGAAPTIGDSLSPSGGWIDYSTYGTPSTPSPFYGISGVLTVPAPEPGTIFLAGIAVTGLAASSLRRRRSTKVSVEIKKRGQSNFINCPASFSSPQVLQT